MRSLEFYFDSKCAEIWDSAKVKNLGTFVIKKFQRVPKEFQKFQKVPISSRPWIPTGIFEKFELISFERRARHA
jgi:hypothetical protein